MRGSRSFAANARKTAAELEAMGVKGAAAMGSLARAGDRMQTFGSRMTRSLTLPVAGAGFIIGKFAIDFDESMRNVNSIAQLPEKNLQNLQRQVLNLAGPTAQSPQTLADSLYDLVSSGFDAKQSMTVLRSAAKAATAGLTEAAVSTKAIAAVLNAYHLPAAKAKDISDTLFKTVDRGVISFEDLSTTIGDVLPFASSLGVDLNQVGASVATMTKAGISPSETMTRIKNVMVAMLKPSEDLAKAIKAQGFESGEAMIKQLGFQGSLDKLVKATGGSKEEVAKLFPNIRALGGALALTGDNAKGAHEDLKDMADSAGATNTALGQQKQSLAYKMHQLSAQFQAIAIKTAPPLLDAFAKIMGAVAGLGEWFKKLPAPVREFAVNAFLVLAAVGPLTWALGALLKGPFALLAASKGVILFFQGLTATMAFTEAGVIGATSAMIGFDLALLAIPLAIVAVVAGFAILYLKVKAFRDAVDSVVSFIRQHWQLFALVPMLGGIVVLDHIIRNFGSLKSAAQDALGWIKNAAGNIGGWFSGAWEAVTNGVTTAFETVKSSIVDALNFIIDRINDVIKGFNALPGPNLGLIGHVGEKAKAPAGPHGPLRPGMLGPVGPQGPTRRAMGGPVLPGGTALVGERGPELATFPFGASITSTDQTKKLLASDRDAPTIVIPIHLNGRVIAEETVRAGQTAKARK